MLEAGIVEDDTPFSGRLPRCVASIGVHDPGKRSDPGYTIVPHIPDQGERAVWLQNAKNFVYRLLIVEPMERGRATDEVCYVIGNRNELGTADEHLDCRKTIDRDACSHLLDRFHGHDAASGQRQKLGELSRASAKIDDGVGGWE